MKKHKEDEELRYIILKKFKNYFIPFGLSASSIGNYMSVVRSYFDSNFISIAQGIYKKVVKPPKVSRMREDGIDLEDVREILLKITDLRLRTFIFVLATSALRANEAITLRWSDINFNIIPTTIHVRKEASKTDSSTRYVYISKEATTSLKEWELFKYRKRDKHKKTPIKSDNDMVFSVLGNRSPTGIYITLNNEFKKVLDLLDERLQKVTFHDFRSFLNTMISDSDYRAVFLGHSINSDNVYFKMKEPARREYYEKNVEPRIKFLNYSKIVADENDMRAKLQAVEKDKDEQIKKLEEEQHTEIEALKIRHEKEIQRMDLKLDNIMALIRQNPKLASVKPESLKKKLK